MCLTLSAKNFGNTIISLCYSILINLHLKDLHETITMLARMSRFVIADITDAKSIPQELVSIVEQLPSLPVQPILQQDCEPWAMFDHIKRYPWVLELYRYTASDEFIPRLREVVISPAEMKVIEIRKKG